MQETILMQETDKLALGAQVIMGTRRRYISSLVEDAQKEHTKKNSGHTFAGYTYCLTTIDARRYKE